MMHSEVITPSMRQIATVIASELDEQYYLAGGTALALFTGHRESVDLDYFINAPIDTGRLKTSLSALFPAIQFSYEEVNTLWCVIDAVKVSFISRLVPLLDPPVLVDGFRLAEKRDLLVMKLNAVCSREEYKDYYDIAELVRHTDVRSWTAWWLAAYPESDPLSWITALAHVAEVNEVPLRGSNIRSKQEVVSMLLALPKELTLLTDLRN